MDLDCLFIFFTFSLSCELQLNEHYFVYFQCAHSPFVCCPDALNHGIPLSETVCWRFGSGVCTPITQIPNYERYTVLIQDVDSRNFEERFRLYWKEVGQNKSDEWLEERLQALRQLEAEVDSNSSSSPGLSDSTILFICFGVFVFIIIFFRVIVLWCCKI